MTMKERHEKLYDLAKTDSFGKMKDEVAVVFDDGEEEYFTRTTISEGVENDIVRSTWQNKGIISQVYLNMGEGMAHVALQLPFHSTGRFSQRASKEVDTGSVTPIDELKKILSDPTVAGYVIMEVMNGKTAAVWDARNESGLVYFLNTNFRFGSKGDYRGELVLKTAMRPYVDAKSQYLFVEDGDLCIHIDEKGEFHREHITENGHFRQKIA